MSHGRLFASSLFLAHGQHNGSVVGHNGRVKHEDRVSPLMLGLIVVDHLCPGLSQQSYQAFVDALNKLQNK